MFGVALAHGAVGIAFHRGIAERLVGWADLPVLLVAGLLLFPLAWTRRGEQAPSRIGVQLGSQLLLIGGVEVVEAVVTLGSSGPLPVGSLHDPVVWLGLAAQVAAALVVHHSATAIDRSIAAGAGFPPVLGNGVPRGLAVAQPSVTGRRLPSALVRRGPPSPVHLSTRS